MPFTPLHPVAPNAKKLDVHNRYVNRDVTGFTQRTLRLTFFTAVLVFTGTAVFLFWTIFKTVEPSEPEVVDTRVPRLLDGVLVDASEQKIRPVGILIDGMVDGRPTVGLAKAPLVWEAPVEGGITRFLAIYPWSAAPEVVGSVRSLRPYFLDFAEEVGAVLLHVGGSPEALTRAKTFSFDRLNQFFDGQYFWRSSERPAPHNVFTSQYLIARSFTDRGFSQEKEFSPWSYRVGNASIPQFGDGARPVTSSCSEREGTPCTTSACEQGCNGVYPVTSSCTERKETRCTQSICEQGCNGVRIVFSTPPYTAEWQWNGGTGVYERSVGGERHRDVDGTAIDAANVLVQFTSVQILDAIGRRRITTEGEGKALVATRGQVLEATWRKEAGGRTRFFDTSKQGVEVAFAPGTTWIEVVSEKTDVTVTPFSAILEKAQ